MPKPNNRARRIARGQCVRCPKQARPDRQTCQNCADNLKIGSKRRYRQAYEAGVCYNHKSQAVGKYITCLFCRQGKKK